MTLEAWLTARRAEHPQVPIDYPEKRVEECFYCDAEGECETSRMLAVIEAAARQPHYDDAQHIRHFFGDWLSPRTTCRQCAALAHLTEQGDG